MKAQKVLYWVILLVVAVNLAIIAVVVLGSHSTPPTPLPNPNGYDDFVKAGALLTKDRDPWDYRTLSESELRIRVRTNAETLRLARIGLGHECRVPPYGPTNLQHISEMLNEKRLAYGLMAEGRLKELDQRTNDALQVYLDTVRFGHEVSRGGPIIDCLVGSACEGIGLAGLAQLAPNLTADQCRKGAGTLQDVDQRSETMDQVMVAERAFVRRNTAWARLLGVLYAHQTRVLEGNFATKFQAAVRSRRQTLLDFATRAYTLDKGAPPKTAADLVPAYLKAVPQDPVTGADMALGHSPR